MTYNIEDWINAPYNWTNYSAVDLVRAGRISAVDVSKVLAERNIPCNVAQYGTDIKAIVAVFKTVKAIRETVAIEMEAQLNALNN